MKQIRIILHTVIAKTTKDHSNHKKINKFWIDEKNSRENIKKSGQKEANTKEHESSMVDN